MAIDTSRLAFPKPEPRRRIKPRKRRAEAARVVAIRSVVVTRDGYCRAAAIGECHGPSEFAHHGSSRRSLTRGMSPEDRHTTAGSLMLCRRHHALYDGRLYSGGERLVIEALSDDGCDGRLIFRLGGTMYEEKGRGAI